MKYEKYFPIGTVVKLKGATKRCMIIGFCAMTNDNNEKVYDYSGCLYPEGLVSSNQTLLFDHDQIAQIYHFGLTDEEEKTFQTKLKELNNKIK